MSKCVTINCKTQTAKNYINRKFGYNVFDQDFVPSHTVAKVEIDHEYNRIDLINVYGNEIATKRF